MPSRRLLQLANAIQRPASSSTIGNYICPSCRLTTIRQSSRQKWHSTVIASGRPDLDRRSTRSGKPVGDGPARFGRVVGLAKVQARRNSTSSTAPTPRQTTAVNLPPKVHPALSNLHNALREIERVAANYVNLGRLKLAIRSLEFDSVKRVGVLALRRGSESAEVAQRHAQALAGVLLADILSDKKEWESVLGSAESRAILIQQGSTIEAKDNNSVFRSIRVDSPMLKQHNIEILVSTLDISEVNAPTSSSRDAQQEGLLDVILVPRLEASASSSGGYSVVGYPVHKALLLGTHIDDALAVGLYASSTGSSTLPPDLIKLAIDDAALARAHRLTTAEGSVKSDDLTNDSILPLDVAQAHKAVETFRASVANATSYQREWNESLVDGVTRWLENDRSEETGWSRSLKANIAELLDTTCTRIANGEAALKGQHNPLVVSDETRSSIDKAVELWAESAHQELRDSLDVAFATRQWRKLSWWKLPWRVDEVSLILADVLDRWWLARAEKGVIFLAGRVQETGLLERKAWETGVRSIASAASAQPNTSAAQQTHGILQPATAAPAMLLTDPPDEAQAAPFAELTIPYPQHIPATRQALLASTVPDMHALAQRLLLTALSTTTLTTALSALYYVSFPLTTLYEAGAIAALGLVFGLRRLQRQWQAAQQDWQAAVRDEGRRALLGTEASLRGIVARGGPQAVDDVLVQEIEDAKLVVAEARLALDSIDVKV